MYSICSIFHFTTVIFHEYICVHIYSWSDESLSWPFETWFIWRGEEALRWLHSVQSCKSHSTAGDGWGVRLSPQDPRPVLSLSLSLSQSLIPPLCCFSEPSIPAGAGGDSWPPLSIFTVSSVHSWPVFVRVSVLVCTHKCLQLSFSLNPLSRFLSLSPTCMCMRVHVYDFVVSMEWWRLAVCTDVVHHAGWMAL